MTTVVTGGESAILESMMVNEVVRDPSLVLKGVSVIGGAMSAQHIRQASGCADLPVN